MAAVEEPRNMAKFITDNLLFTWGQLGTSSSTNNSNDTGLNFEIEAYDILFICAVFGLPLLFFVVKNFIGFTEGNYYENHPSYVQTPSNEMLNNMYSNVQQGMDSAYGLRQKKVGHLERHVENLQRIRQETVTYLNVLSNLATETFKKMRFLRKGMTTENGLGGNEGYTKPNAYNSQLADNEINYMPGYENPAPYNPLGESEEFTPYYAEPDEYNVENNDNSMNYMRGTNRRDSKYLSPSTIDDKTTHSTGHTKQREYLLQVKQDTISSTSSHGTPRNTRTTEPKTTSFAYPSRHLYRKDYSTGKTRTAEELNEETTRPKFKIKKGIAIRL